VTLTLSPTQLDRNNYCIWICYLRNPNYVFSTIQWIREEWVIPFSPYYLNLLVMF